MGHTEKEREWIGLEKNIHFNVKCWPGGKGKGRGGMKPDNFFNQSNSTGH
jgi:hypothetical protein